MIKITVIVTTYNRPEYISETLEAIFSQTYKNFEVILVDDGSRENYVDIYKEKYPELTLIKKQNAGISAARNSGVERASGDWIAFCDDDDVWMPDKLERQVEATEYDKEAGLIHGKMELIDKHGIRITNEVSCAGAGAFTSKLIAEKLFSIWISSLFFFTNTKPYIMSGCIFLLYIMDIICCNQRNSCTL